MSKLPVLFISWLSIEREIPWSEVRGSSKQLMGRTASHYCGGFCSEGCSQRTPPGVSQLIINSRDIVVESLMAGPNVTKTVKKRSVHRAAYHVPTGARSSGLHATEAASGSELTPSRSFAYST